MNLKPKPVTESEMLSRLPDPWPEDPMPRIRQHLDAARRKVVVLDDDPTGTQTVHGVPVLTRWSPGLLEAELSAPEPAVYLLTNSRSLRSESARAMYIQIGRDLASAGRRTGAAFTVISRSDSTLRGHFPAEIDAISDALGGQVDAWIIIPFFEEGGRLTIDDTHYLAQDGVLLPVGMSEFARDPDFGYRASNLKDWVAEKTAGRVSSSAVASISIDDLRVGGPEAITRKLMPLVKGAPCVVNAACYRDLEVFTLGLLAAEKRGKHFLCRSAASFARVRAGIASRPLLHPAELEISSGAGLVVVGSYVPRTSRQLSDLLKRSALTPIEVDVARVLHAAQCGHEIERVRAETQNALSRGDDVVIYTSRAMATGSGSGGHLETGQTISDSIGAIVRGIAARPGFIIAKGGITSSVVATEGLRVRRAMVRGQILPGVPVWQLDDESRFPGMPYVVFPGNVGGTSALSVAFEKFKAR